MSCDKLKHQVSQQFSPHDEFILSCDMTSLLHRDTMTVNLIDTATKTFLVLVLLSVNYCNMLHRFVLHSSGKLENILFYENLCSVSF